MAFDDRSASHVTVVIAGAFVELPGFFAGLSGSSRECWAFRGLFQTVCPEAATREEASAFAEEPSSERSLRGKGTGVRSLLSSEERLQHLDLVDGSAVPGPLIASEQSAALGSRPRRRRKPSSRALGKQSFSSKSPPQNSKASSSELSLFEVWQALRCLRGHCLAVGEGPWSLPPGRWLGTSNPTIPTRRISQKISGN